MEQFQAFIGSEAGLALKGALIAAFLDFATGVYAAAKDGTFTLDAVAAFLRKHILGRVAPLGTMLLVGYFGGASGQIFLPFAIAGLIAYAAETVASIKGNLIPPKDGDVQVADVAVELNPIPQD